MTKASVRSKVAVRSSGSRRLRAHALSIFKAAVAASDPSAAVERHLRGIDLKPFRHVYVVGAGKAAASMAQAAERVLGKRLTAGSININPGQPVRLKRIEWRECGHPVPDERGIAGASRIAGIAAAAGKDDLVVCLISGGASALMPLPSDPVTLAEKREVTKLLLACGANIHEINAVRKHISSIKGGQLARLAAPAKVESLLLSDVIGDSIDVIGSGPAAPDASTFASALAVLQKYGLIDQAPVSVTTRLSQGSEGRIADTPKPGDAIFRRVRNTVVGSNRLALSAAARRAHSLGYRTLILASEIEGETREVSRMHAAIAREIARSGQPVKPPACVITGGETTVTLKGTGMGGRNQEFALAAAMDIAGCGGVLIFSAGTDGIDGPTDAAGAMADGDTLVRKPGARAHLDNNDSYHYFQELDDLVFTGPTGVNVMDVRIMLVAAQAE